MADRKKNTESEASADKRVQRSKEAVLAAAHELMSEGGVSGVSMDEVSRRSGVSKTTIYRHWPSRSALMLEACSKLSSWPETPDTGSLKGDVAALAAFLAHHLRSARGPVVLPSIIDAAEHDPEMTQLQASLHAALLVPFLAVAERAEKRGELPPEQSPAEFAAAILAPFFYRRWFSREPLDDLFVQRLVQSLVSHL